MRSTWMAAALVTLVTGLVGCGGDSSPEKRTDMACGNAQGCMVMHSDTPAKMTCSAPEVSSCSTENSLGTCTTEQWDPVLGNMSFVLYVYDPSVLEETAQECTDQGGSWTTPTPSVGASVRAPGADVPTTSSLPSGMIR